MQLARIQTATQTKTAVQTYPLLRTELGPSHPLAEVLIASVTVFGDRASKEVIKIK